MRPIPLCPAPTNATDTIVTRAYQCDRYHCDPRIPILPRLVRRQRQGVRASESISKARATCVVIGVVVVALEVVWFIRK